MANGRLGDRIRTWLIDLLVKSGMCKSKGEGRRFIQQGGVYLNDERISSAEAKINNCNVRR